MNALPKGSFILVSPAAATVATLSRDEVSGFYIRIDLAAGNALRTREAYRLTFRQDVDLAIPLDNLDFVAVMAETYTGDHKELVCYMLACVALGKTFQKDDGNQPAVIAPRVPRKPRPGGAAVPLTFAPATA